MSKKTLQWRSVDNVPQNPCRKCGVQQLLESVENDGEGDATVFQTRQICWLCTSRIEYANSIYNPYLQTVKDPFRHPTHHQWLVELIEAFDIGPVYDLRTMSQFKIENLLRKKLGMPEVTHKEYKENPVKASLRKAMFEGRLSDGHGLL